MSTTEPAPHEGDAPASPGAASTWFVVPLFNEGEVVGDVLRELRTRYPLVVCVDDGAGLGRDPRRVVDAAVVHAHHERAAGAQLAQDVADDLALV